MNVLETKRLILRQLTMEDVGPLHEILSDPLTMRFWPAPLTLEETGQWIERSLQRYAEVGFGRWAVVLKETNQMIGDCGIVRAEIDGRVENDLGYIIHHPFWRKGFGAEAAEGCMRYGIETLGLKRLVAGMATDNLPSKDVAEKIGMKLEKTYHNTKNRGLATYLYAFVAE